MKLKISETARLTGVTVRTLHYYDEIELLKPGIITDTGYRLYDEQNLEMLQQILFFRELDFSLDEIKQILNNPCFNRKEALLQQKILLSKKRSRLNRLIGLIDETLKGETYMSFEEFNMNEVNEAKEKYASEAKERWGESDAYQESAKRTASYNKEDWEMIGKESGNIFHKFAELNKDNILPDSEEALTAVKQWQTFISSNFYMCSTEILQGLGVMYTADERFKNNIDQYGEGTAHFMSQSIEVYCRKSILEESK